MEYKYGDKSFIITTEKNKIIFESFISDIGNNNIFSEEFSRYLITEILPSLESSDDHHRKGTKRIITKYTILLRYKKEYYFVRGELNYIEDIVKKLDKDDLILGPSEIDFISPLKEKSRELNYPISKKIKNLIETKYSDYDEDWKIDKYDRMYGRKKLFEIKGNRLILNKSTIDDIFLIYDETFIKDTFKKIKI